jgi:hypothetical protein
MYITFQRSHLVQYYVHITSINKTNYVFYVALEGKRLRLSLATLSKIPALSVLKNLRKIRNIVYA